MLNVTQTLKTCICKPKRCVHGRIWQVKPPQLKEEKQLCPRDEDNVVIWKSMTQSIQMTIKSQFWCKKRYQQNKKKKKILSTPLNLHIMDFIPKITSFLFFRDSICTRKLFLENFHFYKFFFFFLVLCLRIALAITIM